MMLVEETTVPAHALPLAAFRAHLRIGTGFAEDGLQDGVLEGFLRAALAAIEGRTGKILLERDFLWTLERWRTVERAVLPVAPVSAIVGFTIEDASGTAQAVPASGWRLVPDMQQPSLVALGGCLPTIPHGGADRIGFMAGFGPEWSDLPADLAQAVLLLAAHYHEYRQETTLGAGCMPFGVTALIQRYRRVRLFGGAEA